jgi:hypothetical protein
MDCHYLLKSSGRFFMAKNLEYWKAQLRKISKILPEDIQKTLKISYDSLDEEEKQIFLDIACFFIGEEEGYSHQDMGRIRVGRIAGSSESTEQVPRGGEWKKCTMLDPVLEVDGKECIRMHDHLETWEDIWRTKNLCVVFGA